MTEEQLKHLIFHGFPFRLTHKNGYTYSISMECKVQIEGTWIHALVYHNANFDTFCRTLTDFENFTLPTST